MNNFEVYIQGALPAVVEFYADWSEQSKRMEPVMEEVKEITRERAITLRMNIDKNRQIAQHYGIFTVPTVAIFKNGFMHWHNNGLTTAHDILDHLQLEIQ